MIYDFETLTPREDAVKYKLVSWENPDIAKGIVPFTMADMEFKIAPEIIEGLKKYLEDEVLGYTMKGENYYESVINWMKRRHDWEIKKEWILGEIDIIAGLRNGVELLTKEEEGVIVMTPVYNPFYNVIENNKRKIVRTALKEEEGYYTIDFQDLEEKAKDPNNTAMILCSPHNPVGRVWTREELEKIGDICLKNNIKIICDEIHHDLIMPGYEHIVLANISKEIADITITCSSATKTFNLAGLPNANVIISNEDMRERYITEAPRSPGNPIGSKACELAYENGEKWLEELIQLIQKNQDLIKDFFDSKYEKIKVNLIEATYLQWIDFRGTELREEELADIMGKEAGVFLTKGSTYGEEGMGFFRINLACPTWILEDALKRLDLTLTKHGI